MKIRLLTLTILLTYNLFGQTKKSFNETDYPKNKFTIKKDRRTLGTVSVDIVQVSPSDSKPNPFYCRTWLTVRNGDKLIEEKYSGDIQPVGSWFGLSFSDRQPNKDLILLSKFGDYDGRIYIVSKNGQLSDFAGGSFYISPDDRYIFSNHYSDVSGVTIFDLRDNKLIYSGELERYISDWYFQDGKYFAIVYDGEKDTKTKLTFDFTTKQFKLGQVTGQVDIKSKLKHYNNPKEKKCECGK